MLLRALSTGPPEHWSFGDLPRVPPIYGQRARTGGSASAQLIIVRFHQRADWTQDRRVRFEEHLPWGHTIAYGLDLSVGPEWFGELIDSRSEQVLSSYDLLSTAYDRNQPIRGLLLWIGVAAEHFGQDELDQCLATVLADGDASDAPDCFGFVLHVMGNLAIAARCLARG